MSSLQKAFEARYFPLKREFRLRAAKYRRCRSIAMPRSGFAGKILTLRHLDIPSVTAELKGRRILFISDWHWHDSLKQRQLLSEFVSSVKSLAPDMLLLGGDLCDDAEFLPQLPVLLEKLGSLAPHVFAVNGNWEAGKRWLPENYFADLYRKYNITLLENQSVECGPFYLTGMPDISSINFHQLSEVNHAPDRIGLLLTHSPDGVVVTARSTFLRNFDLAFCGHTHGGQIRLPLAGALYCPSFYRCKFDRGIFGCYGMKMKMIVSSGIGEHNNSFRFLCPPEIIAVEFK